ncbi:MAG: flagellar basal body rod protein FlgB [Ignavibacteria bacterium]|jgi:flagellar basal-body rod protein FlgB|nr:flagellar basal body rod protein FlgB [Ignavibacteria bacterium]
MIFRQYLFKTRLPLMNKALDTYALRQRTISKNIANATSPHYRPEEVKFEEFFKTSSISLEGQNKEERHIPLGKKSVQAAEPEIDNAEVPSPEVYFSGETHVNIDKEMSNLAQNQIRFRFASQMVKGYFTGLTGSIRGMLTQ